MPSGERLYRALAVAVVAAITVATAALIGAIVLIANDGPRPGHDDPDTREPGP